MSTLLPLAEAAGRACSSCHAFCCEIYVVHIGGHDLHRLVRGLDLPWAAIAEVSPRYPAPPAISFRLDASERLHCLSLRRKPSGVCGMLLELPVESGAPSGTGGHLRRCSVHAFRPWACRAYPLEIDRQAPEHVALREDAACRSDGLRRYRAAIPELGPAVRDDRGEEVLYRHVLRRWDVLAARTPSTAPLTADAYVAWVLEVYDAIEPLRWSAADRGEWQLEAAARVDGYPLPG